MKPLALILFVALLFVSVPISAQEPLNNDTVFKLVKAGLGEDLIISMVKQQPGKYSVSADDLIVLKHAGVTEKIISAMVNKNSDNGPASLNASTADVSVAANTVEPASGVSSKTTVPLSSVKKIYIEKMDNDLDQYVRAEFVKQFRGSVTVVLDPKNADAILVGVNQETKGTGAKITGRYLGLHDIATGTMSLLDKEGKTILWSDEAGDRSLLFGIMKRGGQRKVADRLVRKLKKAMEQR